MGSLDRSRCPFGGWYASLGYRPLDPFVLWSNFDYGYHSAIVSYASLLVCVVLHTFFEGECSKQKSPVL